MSNYRYPIIIGFERINWDSLRFYYNIFNEVQNRYRPMFLLERNSYILLWKAKINNVHFIIIPVAF